MMDIGVFAASLEQLFMAFYPRGGVGGAIATFCLDATAPALGCFGASNAPGRVISSQLPAGETDPLPVRRQIGRA